jgi:hypothetical protein
MSIIVFGSRVPLLIGLGEVSETQLSREGSNNIFTVNKYLSARTQDLIMSRSDFLFCLCCQIGERAESERKSNVRMFLQQTTHMPDLPDTIIKIRN